MEVEKSAVTPPAESRARKIVKYSISLGLVWFIVHSWFINYIRPSHTSACTHRKYAWAMDAFAPKAPQVPRGRLAENFFLCVFFLISIHLVTCHTQYHTELGQCNRNFSQIRDGASPCRFGWGLTHCQVLPRSSPTRALYPQRHRRSRLPCWIGGLAQRNSLYHEFDRTCGLDRRILPRSQHSRG